MTRGIGAVPWLQAILPDWSTVIIAGLTQLGATWLLGTLIIGLYWRRPADRSAIAGLVGVWLTGIGIYLGLKAIFGLPRPTQVLIQPATLGQLPYELIIAGSEHGFPSGHATNATLVYGGLAGLGILNSWRRRWQGVGSALVIGTVALSRVALGVHYLVDVVAGVILGGIILLVVTGLRRHSKFPPTTAFAAATVAGGSAALIAPTTKAVGVMVTGAVATIGGRWARTRWRR